MSTPCQLAFPAHSWQNALMPLEVKEGILLDKDGSPIETGARPRSRDRHQAWSEGPDLRARMLQFRVSNNPLLLLLIPVVLVLGILLFVVGVIVAVPILILRALFR